MGIISFAGHWKPDKRRSLREHRNAGLEVVCVTGGIASWQVEGQTVRVPAGSLVVTWPWERHGSVMPSEPGLELTFACIRMQRAYRREPKQLRWHKDMGLQPRQAQQLIQRLRRLIREHRTARYSEALLWTLQRMVQSFENPGEGARLLDAALSQTMLIDLQRCLEQNQPVLAVNTDHRVQQVLERVERQCEHPWSLENMAAACGLRRSRFTDLVRKQTGDTPMMFVNRMRVKKATQLLQASDRTVTDIALSSGFGSSQYFCRVFKAYTGKTPREIRDATAIE